MIESHEQEGVRVPITRQPPFPRHSENHKSTIRSPIFQTQLDRLTHTHTHTQTHTHTHTHTHHPPPHTLSHAYKANGQEIIDAQERRCLSFSRFLS